MRSVLLWAAQNRWLAAHVPRWRFARRAVRRFLPGEGFDAALKAAVDFRKRGIGSLFTLLGENVTDLEDANRVVQHYEEVLAATGGVEAEISVKPTQLGLDIDEDAAYANLKRLARAAGTARSFMWVDMESSAYTERTVELYRRLRSEHAHVGIALQAYLHRTVSDIARLLPFRPAIRLVKGAYAEHADIAFTSRKEVDANYLALAVFMLPEVKRRKLRMVLATHDVELIARSWRFAQALEMQRSELEIAMLYGIRMDQQERLAREGFTVRDLIAYGDAWYQWYLRRLAERPANVWFVARQLLP
ncbi:MAG TPA: proline dehydrogenase family protein [Candidatus Dormibacteraeota bacterium]|jgi:proline dehydrogenase|nr:proline dehydrogenase family protein [Candidatus Dormibacteraeota bacterium]